MHEADGTPGKDKELAALSESQRHIIWRCLNEDPQGRQWLTELHEKWPDLKDRQPAFDEGIFVEGAQDETRSVGKAFAETREKSRLSIPKAAITLVAALALGRLVKVRMLRPVKQKPLP